MKHIIYIITASALMLTPWQAQAAKSKAPVADSRLVQTANGAFSVAPDSTTAAFSEALQLGAATYTPYAPKARVYNAQKPLIKVTMEEEPERNQKGEPTGKTSEKWYFEIPDSLLGRQLLMYSRLAQVPPGFDYGTHQETTEGVYAFYLSPDRTKLQLKEMPTSMYADTLYSISKAVDLSNTKPIVKVFKVESHNNGVYRIEANSLLMEEKLLTLPAAMKSAYRFNTMDSRRSRIASVHSYEGNVEILTTRTYQTESQTIATSAGSATIGLSSTIILLPETPMTGRLADPRVGYKSFRVTEFSDNQQSVERKRYTTRWRLEPRNAEEAQQQLSGTAIEPKRPIRYYIDPAFPEKWHPYIQAGVAQWREAFEQAGWKNAIEALEWPTADSTASMEDSRFNVIRYVPGLLTMVSGDDYVFDPRTGEILNAPILVRTGALQELRNNYVGDCGAVDEDSHTALFPDELMGALISHQIARAVGTTLGLTPNMLSSTMTPTDSLRSKSYIQRYGIAPSITDMLPYNFVAQPGDGLTRNELIPRVGDADAWSIRWGYGPIDETDEQSISRHLVALTTDHLAANPRHQWGNGDGLNDPRCQPNDLGDDQVKAAAYGVSNLKRIAPYLVEWGSTNRDIHYNSYNAYYYWAQIDQKYARYCSILLNNLTGRCKSPLPATAEGTVYFYRDANYVERCIDSLFSIFGQQAKWVQSDPTQRFSWATPERAGLAYAGFITNTPSISTLHNLHPSLDPMAFAMRVYEFCFKQATPGTAPDLYNRTLQSRLLNTMTSGFKSTNDGYATGDERAVLRYVLIQMQNRLKSILPSAPDDTTRNHYAMLLEQLEDFFTIRAKQASSAPSSGTIVITLGATD